MPRQDGSEKLVVDATSAAIIARLKHVRIGPLQTDDEPFDADENPWFFVPISYKTSDTDVTADFEVRGADDGYVLACKIIHVM